MATDGNVRRKRRRELDESECHEEVDPPGPLSIAQDGAPRGLAQGALLPQALLDVMIEEYRHIDKYIF